MLTPRPLRFTAALLLLLTGLAACQSEGPEQGATVNDIVDNPQQYLGQNVTVSGEINRVFGDASFLIGGDDFENALIVFIAPTAEVRGQRPNDDQVLQEGDVVQVTGQVRRFATVEAEGAAGQNVNVEYGSEAPAVTASVVYLTPRVARADRPADTAAAVTTDTTASDTLAAPSDTTAGAAPL